MKVNYIKSLLSEHEKILYLTRQHWFIFVGSILVEILVVFIIAILTLVINVLVPGIGIWLLILVPMILVFVPVIGGIRDFLIWWNRQYIITNRRVIQVSGVINKNVIDSSLEKVNDVKMDQSVIGRLFNFGNVEILTASELGANVFRRIGDPVHFKTAMLNAKEKLERGNGEGPGEEDIPALIEQLDQLRQEGIITEEEFQLKKAELLSKM